MAGHTEHKIQDLLISSSYRYQMVTVQVDILMIASARLRRASRNVRHQRGIPQDVIRMPDMTELMSRLAFSAAFGLSKQFMMRLDQAYHNPSMGLFFLFLMPAAWLSSILRRGTKFPRQKTKFFMYPGVIPQDLLLHMAGISAVHVSV